MLVELTHSKEVGPPCRDLRFVCGMRFFCTVLISIAYARILLHFRKVSRHLPVREDEVTGRQMPSNRSMKEVAVAMNLCVLCIVFVACWTPGNLVYFLPRALIWMKRVFFGVAIGDSCLNFFIYAAMNRAFRESYVHIVRCVLTCKWSNIVE